ncbi:MAG TPA: hypothetical protein VLX68_02325 [Chitinivibrionales bacterium]|nr:hypothetical protein [Chitinivibrionales bacterium]
MTTTSADGEWVIGGTVIKNLKSQASALASPVAFLPRGEIQLSLQEAAQVSVKTYSVDGKQIGSMQQMLAAGKHSIMPARVNSGIYLYGVAVNGKAYLLQQATVNGRIYPLLQGNGGARFQGFAKNAALTFPDSILCWALGYAESEKYQATATGSGIALTLTAEPSTCPQLTCGYSGTTDPPGSSYAGYYVFNNTWNQKYFNGGGSTQCMNMCSYHQWYVTANLPNHGGEVQTYPCTQKIYQTPPIISSLAMCKVDVSSRSPHAANQIYDGAFDIWINGVANPPQSTELMIWLDNWHQWDTMKPAQEHVILDGIEWIPHADTNDLSYIMYEPAVSGNPVDMPTIMNLDILAIMKHALSKGYMPANSTLYQVQYGVEICSTNQLDALFYLDNYVVHTY